MIGGTIRTRTLRITDDNWILSLPRFLAHSLFLQANQETPSWEIKTHCDVMEGGGGNDEHKSGLTVMASRRRSRGQNQSMQQMFARRKTTGGDGDGDDGVWDHWSRMLLLLLET